MTTKVFRHEMASAQLVHVNHNIFALANLWSQVRGHGQAKALMQKICEYADQNRLTLILIVQEYGWFDPNAMNNAQLEVFYEKFGFKRDPESRPPHTMTRVHNHI